MAARDRARARGRAGRPAGLRAAPRAPAPLRAAAEEAAPAEAPAEEEEAPPAPAPATSAAPAKEDTPVEALLKTLPGVSLPYDEPYYDPAQFAGGATVPEMRLYREAELVHCRVCMLAAVGFLVDESVGPGSWANFDGHIQGTALEQFAQAQGFWPGLLIVLGVLEVARIKKGYKPPVAGESWAFPGELKEEYEMGDLGFDPLGLCPTDPARLYDLKTRELNNGRLAMIGVAGFFAQEWLEPGVKLWDHRGNIWEP